MSAAEALKRRRGKYGGKMGGGGRVQTSKTPPKNIQEIEQKRKSGYLDKEGGVS
jgi:hypothetical protein